MRKYFKQNKCNLDPDKLLDALDYRKRKLEEAIHFEKNQKRYNQSDSRLRISKSNGTAQYYLVNSDTSSQGKYIPKKSISIAKDIAQGEYNKDVICELERELRIIEKTILSYKKSSVEGVYDRLNENRKVLINPIILPDNEYIREWKENNKSDTSFMEDERKHSTVNGESVRSKSEVMIADALNRLGVPYVYESCVYVSGLGTVHADFKCLNVRVRKEIIWEHLGMMDYDEYVNKAINKINCYIMDGYYPGDNLILTYETLGVPLNGKVIEKIIHHYLL